MNTSPLRSPARLSKSRPQSSRTQNLHLPGLPRFHPANYPSPSSDSSSHSSPYSTPPLDSPQPPIRQQHRPYSDPYSVPQRHMYLHPRHGPSPLGEFPPTKLRSKPNSPRLNPLGSPGPVTPFDLEDCMSYLSVRTVSQKNLAELAEKMDALVGEDGDDIGDGTRVSLVDGSAVLMPRSRPGTPVRA